MTRWRRGIWVSLAILALSALSLSPYVVSSTEVIRVRNALALSEDVNTDIDWTPEQVPADFKLERGDLDPQFVAIAAQLGLGKMDSDWERALAISRHLLGSAPVLVGEPIQSDLRDTYGRITQQGQGYCVDFTRVFMALAVASEVPVRSWAFSFDGYGGHGHVLPEIWNRQLRRWQLVDVFNNVYFHRADGIAISAAELRKALREAPDTIQTSRLFAGARPGYVDDRKLWDYYRAGLSEWYMFWGNNVFSYDKRMAGRWPGRVARSLEQLDAMAIGVFPAVRLVPTPDNQEQIAALWRLRQRVLAAAAVAAVSLIAFTVCLIGAWLAARRAGRTTPK